MINDPITKVMQDASEIVRYDEVGIPLYIREGLLSSYPDHRALCHWHEDIEWVQIRSGQMNYYMNGKRVLLNTGEATHGQFPPDALRIFRKRAGLRFYPYSVSSQNFHHEQCSVPVVYCTGSLESVSGISSFKTRVSGGCRSTADFFLKFSGIKKEHPAAYEIEAAALLSLLWCRLLRSASDDAK